MKITLLVGVLSILSFSALAEVSQIKECKSEDGIVSIPVSFAQNAQGAWTPDPGMDFVNESKPGVFNFRSFSECSDVGVLPACATQYFMSFDMNTKPIQATFLSVTGPSAINGRIRLVCR